MLRADSRLGRLVLALAAAPPAHVGSLRDGSVPRLFAALRADPIAPLTMPRSGPTHLSWTSATETWGFSNQVASGASRTRWAPVLGAAMLIVAVALIGVLVRPETEHVITPSRPSPSTTQRANVQPEPVAPSERAALMPRDVSVTAGGNSVQVRWQPAKNASAVTGYVVTPVFDGKPGRVESPTSSSDLQVVFTNSTALKPGTCFIAASLMESAAQVRYAAADEACLPKG